MTIAGKICLSVKEDKGECISTVFLAQNKFDPMPVVTAVCLQSKLVIVAAHKAEAGSIRAWRENGQAAAASEQGGPLQHGLGPACPRAGKLAELTPTLHCLHVLSLAPLSPIGNLSAPVNSCGSL